MKILAIGAHQDDNEFRVGGMAYKWVQRGHEVRFLSMCNGCGGHHIMTPEQTTARRAGESAEVAKFLGIKYDVWNVDDCTLMADLEKRMELIRYIREFSPDLIIAHRTNDYHADHRASGQLVQDASYILTVPNTCPDVPAMRFMPVIVYNEDGFKNPDFEASYVVGMDDVMDVKLHIAHLNESQVYEWLPYTYGEEAPEGEEERKEWLKSSGQIEITADTTDEEIMKHSRGYAVRAARTAARFRRELIAKYGEEKGGRIRYAEAFQLCEYGAKPTKEMEKELFGF